MPQIPSDPDLKGIESALGELVPRSSRLDRDKLMFQAGAISGPAVRRRYLWPSIAATLCVALAGESLFLRNQAAPRVVERIVMVPAAAPAPSSGGVGNVAIENADSQAERAREPQALSSWAVASDYRRMQDLVIRFGLDALPERSALFARGDDGEVAPAASLKPAGAMRNLELKRILEPGDPS
jgi:hypothetical protein